MSQGRGVEFPRKALEKGQPTSLKKRENAAQNPIFHRPHRGLRGMAFHAASAK
jgi:hypothetical protein